MRCAALFLTLALAQAALGAPPDDGSSDLDALRIADDAKLDAARPTEWRIFVETGAIDAWDRLSLREEAGARASLDAHYDTAMGSGLRFIFSDRLDVEQSGPPATRSTLNTLKEAYVSWQITSDQTLDAGRINLRYGVATGYNPTDYFRSDAIRSIVSIDPSSLRENRLGSVVVESQSLWEDSAFTALVSPRLARTPDTGDFAADWGATNGSNRWLLALSHQFTNDLNPQLLFYGNEGRPPAMGLNVSTLLNSATVAYLEWSGVRGPSLLSEALGATGPDKFRDRAALGITYTTAFNLSFTLEHELNSAGLDEASLARVARAAPLALLDVLGFAQEEQDLPTRRTEFLYASWQDMGIKHLDLSAFLRLDPISHSRSSWSEARYHFDRADLAVQWQLESGHAASVYGAVPTQRQIQILFRYFL